MSSDDVVPAGDGLRRAGAADALLRELRVRLQVSNTDRALQLVRSRDAALQRQKRLLVVLVIVALAAPISIAIRESRWEAIGLPMLFLLPSVAITLWAVACQRSFQSQLNEAGADFYDQWKRDLRIKIRTTIAGAICCALLSVGQAAMALANRFDIWVSVFLGAVSIFTAYGVVRVLTVEVSDLRKEYRIVEESSRG